MDDRQRNERDRKATLIQDDERHDEAAERKIYINQPELNAPFKYPHNAITTSKYTLKPWTLDFILYKNLKEQFRRLANVYFLGVAIIQIIPGISPTGRFTTLLPLVIVMTVSLIKDAWEDLKRHRSDNEVNNRLAIVIRGGVEVVVRWFEVKVGDIVMLKDGDNLMADVIALWTSDPDGFCHVETCELDGETNLKLRKTNNDLRSAFGQSIGKLLQFKGCVGCEQPNEFLYKFDGYLDLQMDSISKRIPLTVDELLLRGASMRNTDLVYGIVINTGDDTKLMRNSREKRFKQSRLEKVTNRQIMIMFLLQFSLCLFSAIALGVTTVKFQNHWYTFLKDDPPAVIGLIGFLTFIILFNNLIPISLYVTIELVKAIQATLMNTDLKMYMEESDTPCIARTSALNEELGQVEYIFSDKTGTLTCNVMDFMRFSVAGRGYGVPATAVRSEQKKKGFSFYDDRISKGKWQSQDNAESIKKFLKLLALCHTIMPKKTENGEVIYQASSPDELCLVQAAKYLGFEFKDRQGTSITITVNGVPETWEVLNVLEFNSTRKRMSVIFRTPEGKIILQCKGADTVIFPRIKSTEFIEETTNLLQDFASDGLRTLVCCELELIEDAYNEWNAKFQKASCSIVGREQKVMDVEDEIEQNMVLLGATAIDDKLQDGVPDAITLFRQAGIKVWVLTGDKQETAINIGFACSLLDHRMHVFDFSEDGTVEAPGLPQLDRYLSEAAEKAPKGKELAIVVQGSMLPPLLKDPLLTPSFLQLASQCKTVICCRVSPLQKAEVVELVKKKVNATCLSIGDGANDVSMIQSAHLGIGISGLEGQQAARAADYAIGQFRFLSQILLVHGRWNYRRISKTVLYSFYKNVCLYLCQFLYCLHNGFSGQSLFDNWALASFNIFFTALPIMAIAILDRDVEAHHVLKFPELYQDGQKSGRFNTRVFWMYCSTAIWHALCCFYVPMIVCAGTVVYPEGRPFEWPDHGIVTFTSIMIVVTFKCALECNTWTWLNHFVTWGSLFYYFLHLLAYTNLWTVWSRREFSDWYHGLSNTLGNGFSWMIICSTVTIALLRDFAYKFYKHSFDPSLNHKIQEFQKKRQTFEREDIEREMDIATLPATVKGNRRRAHTGYAFAASEEREFVNRITNQARVPPPSSPQKMDGEPPLQGNSPPHSPSGSGAKKTTFSVAG